MLKKKNKVVKYITMQPIIDLYKETMQMTGMWVKKRWWEQEGLELAVSRVASVEEERERKIQGESRRSIRELKT